MGTHPIFESDFDCLTERKPKAAQKQYSITPEKLEDSWEKFSVSHALFAAQPTRS